MSWNNKEEIETTCTVQQWRYLYLFKACRFYLGVAWTELYASVNDELVNMEHWWNYTDRGTQIIPTGEPKLYR